MSAPLLIDKNDPRVEQTRRDFVNAIFGVLKTLSLYDSHNDASKRPMALFEQALSQLRELPQAKLGVEIQYREQVLTVLGAKLANHFSIVESSKQVPDFMERAFFEKILISPTASADELTEFLGKWALHCSVHQKPKEFQGEFKNIELSLVDPEKADLRIKSRQVLLSPTYALNHYYLLKEQVEKFFQAVANNELISQRQIRRELIELSEVCNLNPYQLVALSLIRSPDQTEAPVCEAIATSMLSMALAHELEFSKKDQINLGLVALIYNIELIGSDLASVIQSNRQLSPLEYRKVMDAQASGVFRLIKAQGTSRPSLERLLSLFEATQGNSKRSISLNLDSRLLRLTSQYVALTSQRPFRDAYTPAEAMKILGNRAASKTEGNLDPVLYYLFVRFLGVFPVGSVVQLSDHRKAVVFRPSGEKAAVPVVKLIASNPQDSGETLDLSQEGSTEIARALDPRREGVQVSGYFFD